MKKRFFNCFISILLTLGMIVSMVPMEAMAGEEETPTEQNTTEENTSNSTVLEFKYAYDCQRNPSYPSKGDNVNLSAFSGPLDASKNHMNINIEGKSWKLKSCGYYNSSMVETASTADTLANVVSSVVKQYKESNSNITENQIEVSEFLKDDEHICYGVVIATFSDNSVFFIGTTWSGGAGYYFSNSAASGSVSQEVTSDCVTPAHTHNWVYSVDNGTLKVKCNETESQCEYNTNMLVTLDAKDCEYSGNAYAGISLSPTSKDISVKYFKKMVGENNTESYVETTLENSGAASQGGTPVNAGEYKVEASYTFSENAQTYKIEDTFTISPKSIENAYVYLTNVVYNNIYQYNRQEVTQEIDNVYVNSNNLTKDIDYAIDSENSIFTATDCGSYNIKIKGKGNYTGVKIINWYIDDTIINNGTITIKDNNWYNYKESYYLNKYYYNTKQVDITASDSGSGLDKVSYFLADEAKTSYDIESLSPENWTELSNILEGDIEGKYTFNIPQDSEKIVYVKIVDKKDHVKYLSTDKIVFDTTKPKITGISNGASYCSDVTFKVEDANLVTNGSNKNIIKVDGEDKELDEENKYKLVADNKQHTIVATDKAGNTTTYKVSVYTSHSWDQGTMTTDPTCLDNGIKTYRCYYCGATMTNTALDSATGHEYGEPIFNWSGYKSAKVTLICKKDILHIVSLDCAISSEITKQATGTTKGQITHTATAVIDGKTYTDTKIEETETVEQEEVGDGRISTGVTVDKNVPDTVISNLTVDVAKELLSEEELEKVKAGSNLKVYLEVESKDKKVDSSEEKLITTEAEKQVKEFTKDVKVSSTEKIVNKIKYMDLSLYKKIDNNSPVKITDMNNNELEITIDIPEDMRAKDREGVYQVIRIHDKKVNILPSKHDKEKYTLTFKTDRFSTYAVTYVGKEKISAENTKVDESFRKLALKNTKSTNTSNTLSWAKVKEADGYLVYGNRCNQGKTKYAFKLLKTIKGNGTVSFTDKKLKKGTYYKYYVKAYKLVDGKKVILARGKTVHIATTGGKYGNPKIVKVNKDNVSLKVNKKFTIKASMVKADKSIKKHEDIKYESSNTSVATVSSKGAITAKKKGTCTVYVYAQNGVYKKVKVTVK